MNTKPRLVGIFGYANTGKDSIPPRVIIDGQECICFVHPTSAPIIADIQRLIGQQHDLRDRKVKDQFRNMLVHYADDWRKIDPDHWINIYRADAQYSYDSHCTAVNPQDILVFTGLRDPREAKWILDEGGLLVCVVRKGVHSANESEANAIYDIQDAYSYHLIYNDNIQTAQSDLANLIAAHFSSVGPVSPPATPSLANAPKSISIGTPDYNHFFPPESEADAFEGCTPVTSTSTSTIPSPNPEQIVDCYRCRGTKGIQCPICLGTGVVQSKYNPLPPRHKMPTDTIGSFISKRTGINDGPLLPTRGDRTITDRD